MFAKQVLSRARRKKAKAFLDFYADLMTALMILFLVVMVASLLMVTQRIAIETQK